MYFATPLITCLLQRFIPNLQPVFFERKHFVWQYEHFVQHCDCTADITGSDHQECFQKNQQIALSFENHSKPHQRYCRDKRGHRAEVSPSPPPNAFYVALLSSGAPNDVICPIEPCHSPLCQIYCQMFMLYLFVSLRSTVFKSYV